MTETTTTVVNVIGANISLLGGTINIALLVIKVIANINS